MNDTTRKILEFIASKALTSPGKENLTMLAVDAMWAGVVWGQDIPDEVRGQEVNKAVSAVVVALSVRPGTKCHGCTMCSGRELDGMTGVELADFLTEVLSKGA